MSAMPTANFVSSGSDDAADRRAPMSIFASRLHALGLSSYQRGGGRIALAVPQPVGEYWIVGKCVDRHDPCLALSDSPPPALERPRVPARSPALPRRTGVPTSRRVGPSADTSPHVRPPRRLPFSLRLRLTGAHGPHSVGYVPLALARAMQFGTD